MEFAGFLGSGRHPFWGSSGANTNGLIHYGQRCDLIIVIAAHAAMGVNIVRNDTHIHFSFPRGGAGNSRIAIPIARSMFILAVAGTILVAIVGMIAAVVVWTDSVHVSAVARAC